MQAHEQIALGETPHRGRGDASSPSKEAETSRSSTQSSSPNSVVKSSALELNEILDMIGSVDWEAMPLEAQAAQMRKM